MVRKIPEDQIDHWITVNGNHIPVKKGESEETAFVNWMADKEAGYEGRVDEFDDTDDIDIDVETEDEKIKYDTLYYADVGIWSKSKRIIDKDEIEKYRQMGYEIHQIDVTSELKDILDEAMNSELLKDNNIRGVIIDLEAKLKSLGGFSWNETRLLVDHFRKDIINKAKEYADEFLETLPKTKQTLPEACSEAVNTKGYKESKGYSYNSKEYDWYTSNCQRCIIAYEMRRRGYDVEANKYNGNKDPIYNVRLSCGRAFLDFDSMRDIKNYDVQPNGEKYSSRGALIHAMEKDMKAEGEGARFALIWKWKNSNWGHTVNAEIIDGEVRIFDSQDNTQSTIKDLIDNKSIRATTLQVVRLDNKVLSNRLEDLVKWKK